tara:strand:+ start:4298 stop:4579 length:282 start_codon:yes stop_codon:yes gene_type:complete
MILEILTYILAFLVVILGYTTINLLRKNETAEDIIVSQKEFINKFRQMLDTSSSRLKEIDENGTFESDDEIGWFFKEIKNLQNALSQFTNPNN